MADVKSNNLSIQYAREASLRTLPTSPNWFNIEPNRDGLGDIGATYTTSVRTPLSTSRGNRKGTIVDLDSAIGFTSDITVSNYLAFIEAFLFSNKRGADFYLTGSVTATHYVIDDTNFTATDIMANTLLFASGFAQDANNGLKTITSATGNNLVVSGLVAEAARSTYEERVEICGIQQAADTLSVAVSGNNVTITSTANIFNNNPLGFIAGMEVYFPPATSNGFQNSTNNGFGRIRSVAQDGSSITIDKTTAPWTLEAAGSSSNNIRIFVGQFIRDVDVTNPGTFAQISHQFEIAYPNLLAGGATGYEYSQGNFANELVLTFPLSEKATMQTNFIGTDTLIAVPSAQRATNAAASNVVTRSTAFNTTNDYMKLRTADESQQVINTLFKTFTINISNGVSAEKTQARLGAEFMNYGAQTISVTSSTVFTDPVFLSSSRANETLGLDFAIQNENGVIHVDIPSSTIEGGARSFPTDESVLQDLTWNVFVDDFFNHQIGFTFFPYIPE